MADKTHVEWTDATVNFWWGCTKVGPGCDHCYAEAHDARFGGAHWGQGAPRRKIKSASALIYSLHNDYAWWFGDHGRRRRVFIQSMSDLFDLEIERPWFAEAWQHIETCWRLDIQIVTKRVSAVAKRLAEIGRTSWPEHAGLIVTIVNQSEADRDIPRLIALKEALRIPWIGLSIEPMLGPIDLTKWLHAIDWVICGGESGPHARPMHPDWAGSLRDQCAGVAFFFKQWGEWAPICAMSDTQTDKCYFPAPPSRPDATRREKVTSIILHKDGNRLAGDDRFKFEAFASGSGAMTMFQIGKKASGALLDGVQHHNWPKVAA